MGKVARKKTGASKAPKKRMGKEPRAKGKPQSGVGSIEAPEKETRPTKTLADGRLNPKTIEPGDRVLVVPRLIKRLRPEWRDTQPRSWTGKVHAFVMGVGKDKKQVIGADVWSDKGGLSLARFDELYPTTYRVYVADKVAKRTSKKYQDPSVVFEWVGKPEAVTWKNKEGAIRKVLIPNKPFILADVVDEVQKTGAPGPEAHGHRIIRLLVKRGKIKAKGE